MKLGDGALQKGQQASICFLGALAEADPHRLLIRLFVSRDRRGDPELHNKWGELSAPWALLAGKECLDIHRLLAFLSNSRQNPRLGSFVQKSKYQEQNILEAWSVHPAGEPAGSRRRE